MGDEAACLMPNKPVAAARGGYNSLVGETPEEELRAECSFFTTSSLSVFFLPPNGCGSTNLARGVWVLLPFVCPWAAF